MRKILILVTLSLILCSTGMPGAAYGDQTAGSAQPPPAIFFKMGLTGISGDSQYLYVMAGGKIIEYQLSNMTLLLSVDLPDPAPPSQAVTPPKASGSGQLPPPHHHPPYGLWAGNGSLYVLEGPFVYIYSVPGLTLQSTVQLPAPVLPQAGQ